MATRKSQSQHAAPPADPGQSPPPDTGSSPSFEEAIGQVEQIIERIERGEQGLERSIADYERGATLLKRCREILARSEQRIQEIEADLSDAAQPPAAPRKAAGKDPSSTLPPASADDTSDTPF